MSRGCGDRVAGGCYAESGLHDKGFPIEHFIKDAPQVMDFEAMGISAIGVKLVEFGGVWHVFDWVGETHYPYPADFIEEARVQGVSRRLPVSLEFDKITAQSRMFLIHAKAHVLNPYDYYDRWGAINAKGWVVPDASDVLQYKKGCPKSWCTCSGDDKLVAAAHERAGHAGMCARIWWHDFGMDELAVPEGVTSAGNNIAKRIAPGSKTTYPALPRPDGVVPEYVPAVFGIFPLERIVIIKDPEGDTHLKAHRKAVVAGVPVESEEA